MVLAQVQIAAKSNEIPAFRPLLQQVAARLGGLDGVVVVADALHAQTTHAADVAALGGHLDVSVKADQPTLFTQLKRLPWAQASVGDRRRDTGHARRETRTVKALTVHTPGGLAFPGRTHYPNPDHGRQTHPRDGVPRGVPTRRARPARPSAGLGPP